MNSQGPGSPGFGKVELVGKLGGVAPEIDRVRVGVLITGGSGFLGHALVEHLLSEGCPRICIYSRNEYAQAKMRQHFNDDQRLRFFIGDVRDRDRLSWAMESVQAVIHAAALKRIEVGTYNPIEMVRTNVDGSVNVIDAARRSGVGKVLLVSSDKAFAPVSPYGYSKAIAEAIFLNSCVSDRAPLFAVVRYGNVWNSTGSVLPTWRALMQRGEKKVPVTDPEVTRFFMWREEAAKFVIDALVEIDRQAHLQAAFGGQVFIPDLPAYRLGDLAEALGVEMDVRGISDQEKLHESMAAGHSSDKARRMTVEELRDAIARVA